MIGEILKTIAPHGNSGLMIEVSEPLLTEDKKLDDLELLAITNYLKTYQPRFRPIVEAKKRR